MDRYSRLVAWLKVLLPLAALGLLSTLFLLSRNIDPFEAIPFADPDFQERLRNEQITGPFFSGTTDNGDRLTFSASKLVSKGVGSGENEAEDFIARVDLSTGARVVIEADNGKFDLVGGRSTLRGNVILTSSTGYRVLSDQLDADTTTLMLNSPGPVSATGPMGRLTAGSMALATPQGENAAHLLFKEGVKLIYDPQTSKE